MSPRAAVTIFFALNGFVGASLFARLPAIQDRLDLSNGRIGLALLALTLVMFISQPLAGALAARRGSAPLLTAGGLAVSAAIVAPGLADSFGTLVLSTAAIGLVFGVLDVAMNVQGVAIERRVARPILSGLHAAFSAGMLAGALAAGAAAGAGASPRTHLLGVGLLAALVTLTASRALLPAGADASARAPAFARPTRGLAVLGAIAFCVLLTEGAMADWSAIHLAQTFSASETSAVAGLAAFAATMTLGRLLGDRITLRLGNETHLRSGALIAAAGAVLAATAPSVPVAVVGFALTGIGLSASFPLMVRAAADRAGDSAGPAIAAVSTVGYSGFVTGPPIVGFVAQATSLRFALAAILGLLLVTAASLASAAR